MPEGEPEKCSAEQSQASCGLTSIMRFYSEAAQIRNRPPRVALARLTGDQLRQSIADLYSRFEGVPKVTDGRGIRGVYLMATDGRTRTRRLRGGIRFSISIFGRESPAKASPRNRSTFIGKAVLRRMSQGDTRSLFAVPVRLFLSSARLVAIL